MVVFRQLAAAARAGGYTAAGEAHLSAAYSWLLGTEGSLAGWVTAKAAALQAASIASEPHGDDSMHGTLHHGTPNYKMIQKEDTVSWIVFFLIFVVLILFDNIVLHGKDEKLSFRQALAYTVFYMCCALTFCGYVWFARGPADAFNWGTGYLLEWMLSVDNLFVFRSIFMIFRTPDEQKHKPLFWGIIGAVIFRMLFFVIEEVLVHSFWWMYLLLGAFLIYTGIKIAFLDEEEDNPSTNPVFQSVIKRIRYVDAYAPTALFFARIPDHEEERIKILQAEYASQSGNESEPERTGAATPPLPGSRTSSKSLRSMPSAEMETVEVDSTAPLRATRLCLVVICLEVTDVVFAVDSVSAIVAQIPDLFLAYTACVFAMLGLRAMFFVVDELVHMFSLLSYAVAAILCFIGLKLMLKSWIHIPPWIVCTVLVSTLGLSMVASVIWDKMHPESDEEEYEPPENVPDKKWEFDGVYVKPSPGRSPRGSADVAA